MTIFLVVKVILKSQKHIDYRFLTQFTGKEAQAAIRMLTETLRGPWGEAAEATNDLVRGNLLFASSKT